MRLVLTSHPHVMPCATVTSRATDTWACLRFPTTLTSCLSSRLPAIEDDALAP